MVVKERAGKSKEQGWMFTAPFSWSLWVIIGVYTVFTGMVVSAIEQVAGNEEFSRGSLSGRIITALWFSCCTFFMAHRESLQSNLSRMVVVTWLFVVLILNSSFTATLTSMLTISQLNPSIVNIESLKQSGATVGCNGNSFIVQYLVEVLGFDILNIRRIESIHDYPQALSTGEIAAAFFVEPHAKVFLSIYCTSFAIAGPAYKLGGFGFVFPKGSPLALDISEAILQVNEDGEIQKLEKKLLSSSNCSGPGGGGDDRGKLHPSTFWGLFVITGSVSASALFVSLSLQLAKAWQLDNIRTVFLEKGILRWALALLGGKLL